MIGLTRCWGGPGWPDAARFASSLGLFAGHPADREDLDAATSLFSLAAPRAQPSRGWKAARSGSGRAAVLAGWIDDPQTLAARLGVPFTSHAALYCAALDVWGESADARLTGFYAAIVIEPDSTLRLSRSPLGGLPLFYANDRGAAAICSVPRPIFAAGFPQRLRHADLIRTLAFEADTEHEDSLYEGISRVPDGAVVHLTRDGVRTSQWYDMLALPEIGLGSDDEYLEAANSLLADAVRNALAQAHNPATSLSGGLDSAILADELLRQLPKDRRLSAWSFHAHQADTIACPPTNFIDERPHVRAFAAMHPRLDLHFTDNPGVGFDHKAREFFMACGSAMPAMTMSTVHHGMHMEAAQAGHDVLFNAGSGNFSISSGAPWAYPELLRTGRWSELWQLAANRPGDPRPVVRRIAAHGLLPLLPARLRGLIRRAVHHGSDRADFSNGLLRPGTSRADRPGITFGEEPRSRREWLAMLKPHMGPGAEIVHGYEQVFGIRGIDALNYRPLMEFCFGLPADQLVRGGQSRWLARRMGQGRMPEAQRLERRNGMHNMDWHARMTPRLPELRAMVERIAAQPELAPFVDSERALTLIDNWPSEAPSLGKLENELRFTLPSTLLMSQFVDFVTGRN